MRPPAFTTCVPQNLSITPTFIHTSQTPSEETPMLNPAQTDSQILLGICDCLRLSSPPIKCETHLQVYAWKEIIVCSLHTSPSCRHTPSTLSQKTHLTWTGSLPLHQITQYVDEASDVVCLLHLYSDKAGSPSSSVKLTNPLSNQAPLFQMLSCIRIAMTGTCVPSVCPLALRRDTGGLPPTQRNG